jgi:hypothetical protein
MSDREQDRWRELADLLGLPPDEQKQSAAQPAPPARNEPTTTHHDRAPSRPEAAPPAAEVAEPAMFEEVVITEMNLHEEDYREPESQAREVASEGADEPADDRPRRGRRRGRRGSRNERDDRAPVENSAGREEVTEPSGNETSEDDFMDRTEGGGGPGRRRHPEESHRGNVDEEARHDEEHAELEETGAMEPTTDDADDEEIDRLTDWNVPSWNDLIGSLYRPER